MKKKRVEMTINTKAIEAVLAQYSDSNLKSEAARKAIAEAVESALLMGDGMRFDRYWRS